MCLFKKSFCTFHVYLTLQAFRAQCTATLPSFKNRENIKWPALPADEGIIMNSCCFVITARWSYGKSVRLSVRHTTVLCQNEGTQKDAGRPPSGILGIRKLDTGLSDGEDRILRSLVLTQYGSVTDGRANRRTDGFAVAYIALVSAL